MAIHSGPECVWPPPPDKLTLADNQVHVWCAALNRSPARIRQLAQLLSPAETERANRFVFEEHRQHFTVGRGLLRVILGRYLKVEPQKLQFSYGPQGKPALEEIGLKKPLQFNLSHSHGLALYAITGGQEVGVDLEAIRPLADLEAIAKRFFSRAEYAALSGMPPAQKPAGFFNCWTRKEAFIKALGDGLMYPLDQFDVSLLPGEPARLLRVQDEPEAARWTLYHLSPATDYVGALAVAGPRLKLKCWRWEDEPQNGSGTLIYP